MSARTSPGSTLPAGIHLVAARRSPAPPLPDPRRDRRRVRPGQPAQARCLPGQRLIQLTVACALEDAGHFGQQIGPAVGELAERGHRETSMMPESLLNVFTPRELADLLAYLESLKK